MATKSGRPSQNRPSVMPVETDPDIGEFEDNFAALSKDLDQFSLTLKGAKALRTEKLATTQARAWDVWVDQKAAERELEQIRLEPEEDHRKNVKWLQNARYKAQQERWSLTESVKTGTLELNRQVEQERALTQIADCLDIMRDTRAKLAVLPDHQALYEGTTPEHEVLKGHAKKLLELAQVYTANGGNKDFANRLESVADGSLEDDKLRADLLRLRSLERTKGALRTYDTIAKLTLDPKCPPGRFRGIVYWDVEKTRPFARFDLDQKKHSKTFINHHIWDLIAATYLPRSAQ